MAVMLLLITLYQKATNATALRSVSVKLIVSCNVIWRIKHRSHMPQLHSVLTTLLANYTLIINISFRYQLIISGKIKSQCGHLTTKTSDFVGIWRSLNLLFHSITIKSILIYAYQHAPFMGFNFVELGFPTLQTGLRGRPPMPFFTQ